MRTNQTGNSNYNFGVYQGNLAYETRNKDKYYLIVFTDISGKRYRHSSYDDKPTDQVRQLHHTKWNKVIFITNKQLLDKNHPFSEWGFIADVMELVFDGKRGTRYQTNSSCGGYFWCAKDGKTPIVRKK